MITTNHLITVYNPENGYIRWVTISAFCPECGEDRGIPRLRPQNVDGVDTWLHRWENPCGHKDTNASILAEITTQCAHRNCAIMQSDTFSPYCGPHCAVRSAWEAVSQIRIAVKSLTAPLDTLSRLGAILDTCPFPESGPMTEAVDDLAESIAKAQRRLAARSSAAIFEASGFFEILDTLIANADPNTLHPQWVNARGAGSIIR